MKNYLIGSILVCLGLCAWCGAETFLKRVKPTEKRALKQLRASVSQRMGDLVEQLGHSIELNAQIQQRLCKELRESLEGTKKSLLDRLSYPELTQLSESLHTLQKAQQHDKNVQNLVLRRLR